MHANDTGSGRGADGPGAPRDRSQVKNRRHRDGPASLARASGAQAPQGNVRRGSTAPSGPTAAFLTRVLVDTSVWRRYFSGATLASPLAELLDEEGAVLSHPFVLGELVLGGLSAREEELFTRLPRAGLAPHEEVLELVRRRRLMRRGIGWVDVHLLASALVSSAALWSMDSELAAAAADLDVHFRSESGFGGGSTAARRRNP